MEAKPKISLTQLKKDFSFLKKDLEKGEIIAVLLYGSYANNKQHVRSDIDICIVAPKIKDIKQMAEMLRYSWGRANTSKYDIRLFEELPLKIKISIIENHKIIYSNFSSLQEYFYLYRKLWKDQSINWIGKKN